MSVLAPYDRDALREQFRSAEPFPWLKIDNFLQPEFAEAVARSYPPYEVATGLGRQFKAVNENRKVQIVDYDKFPDPVKRLSDAVANPQFMEDLSYITGISNLMWDVGFAGGGMHETARSGWLDVHVDFNVHEQLGAHRRLNILIFLNPIWDQRWGGVLELWDRDVRTPVHALSPIHNRCVVFETSGKSWHGVTAVNCPDGIARKSFAAYYYTREAPAGWNGTVHDTIFRPRPDEYFKRHVAMPAVAARERFRAGVRNVKGAVKRLLSVDD